MFLLYPTFIMILVAGLAVSHFIGLIFLKRYYRGISYVAGFILGLTLLFGDEIFGFYYWNHLCTSKGGIYVYKVVPVESFWYSIGAADGVSRDYLNKKEFKYAYKFIEGSQFGIDRNRLFRYFIDKSSNLISNIEITSPKSLYKYSYEKVNYPHFIRGINLTVRNSETNELMGIHRKLEYRGGIIISSMLNLFGYNEVLLASCGADSRNVLFETIPPSNTLEGDPK